MNPELPKSEAKIEECAMNLPKWLPDGTQDLFTQIPRRFLAILEPPPRFQNRPKTNPWPQKGRQEAMFDRFFWGKCFSHFGA